MTKKQRIGGAYGLSFFYFMDGCSRANFGAGLFFRFALAHCSVAAARVGPSPVETSLLPV